MSPVWLADSINANTIEMWPGCSGWRGFKWQNVIRKAVKLDTEGGSRDINQNILSHGKTTQNESDLRHKILKAGWSLPHFIFSLIDEVGV